MLSLTSLLCHSLFNQGAPTITSPCYPNPRSPKGTDITPPRFVNPVPHHLQNLSSLSPLCHSEPFQAPPTPAAPSFPFTHSLASQCDRIVCYMLTCTGILSTLSLPLHSHPGAPNASSPFHPKPMSFNATSHNCFPASLGGFLSCAIATASLLLGGFRGSGGGGFLSLIPPLFHSCFPFS